MCSRRPTGSEAIPNRLESVDLVIVASDALERLTAEEESYPAAGAISRERVGAVVARGEAELGFQQLSELKPNAAATPVWRLCLELRPIVALRPLFGQPALAERTDVDPAGAVPASEEPLSDSNRDRQDTDGQRCVCPHTSTLQHFEAAGRD